MRFLKELSIERDKQTPGSDFVSRALNVVSVVRRYSYSLQSPCSFSGNNWVETSLAAGGIVLISVEL